MHFPAVSQKNRTGISFDLYGQNLFMKKLMTLFITATLIAASAKAQLSVNINIGTQPIWGPVGYDHVDYYYIPDADIYYYVPERVYIYRTGNAWHRTTVLPARYKNIDLYNVHKVVINNVDKPYLNNDRYQREYASFKGRHDQTPIRDSKEEKYFQNKNHPMHAQWQKEHGGGNGKGNGNGHGKGGKKH
jgi:hypothetical protein